MMNAAEAPTEVEDVALDRLLAKPEGLGDGPIAGAGGEQVQDLALAGAEGEVGIGARRPGVVADRQHRLPGPGHPGFGRFIDLAELTWSVPYYLSPYYLSPIISVVIQPTTA